MDIPRGPSWLQGTVEYFITTERNPVPISSRSPLVFKPVSPPALRQPLSACLNLPVLDISYQGNHTIGHLCDQLLSHSTVFSRFSVEHILVRILFYCQIRIHCMGLSCFVFLGIRRWTFDLFLFFSCYPHREELLRTFRLNKVSQRSKQWFGEVTMPQSVQSYVRWLEPRFIDSQSSLHHPVSK